MSPPLPNLVTRKPLPLQDLKLLLAGLVPGVSVGTRPHTTQLQLWLALGWKRGNQPLPPLAAYRSDHNLVTSPGLGVLYSITA